MRWKICLVLLVLFLQLALLHAAPVQRQFDYNYQQSDTRSIMTDLEAKPSITAPSNTYCAGATVPLTITVPQRNWLITSGIYDAQLRNFVGSCGVSALYPYSSVSTAQFNWVTSSQLGTLQSQSNSNPVFNPADSFSNFIPGMQRFQATEGAKYVAGDGSLYGGGTLYKSDIGVYCQGNIMFVPPSGAVPVANDYVGGSIATQNYQLPLTQGSVKLNARTDLSGCVASARTYNSNNGCGRPDVVLLYKNSQGGAQFLSDDLDISVLPKLNCNGVTAVPGQVTPSPPTQGQPFQAKFTITNNGGMAVPVVASQITASAGFTIQSISPSGTVQIPTGTSQEFTATVVAQNSGSQTLTFNIPITVSDCEGTKQCPKTVQYSFNVLPGGGILCAISLDKATFTVTPTTGDSTTARAACTQGGSPVACPALTWSSTIAPPPTPPYTFNPNPSQPIVNPTTTFTVKAGTTAQSGRTVTATGTGVTCNTISNVQVQIGGGGQAASCAITSFVPPSPFTSPVNSVVTTTCKDTANPNDPNAQNVPCPTMAWSVVAPISPQVTIDNVPTASSTLRITGAFASQTNGQVKAASNDPSILVPFSCTGNFIINAGGGGGIAKSCLLSSIPPGPDFASPSSVALTAACKDTANPNDPNAQNVPCPAMRWQQTVASGVTLPSSTIGGTNTMTIAAGVSAPFPQTITSTSNDPPNTPFSCTEQFSIGQGGAGTQIVCSYKNYHGEVFFPPDSADVQVDCLNSPDGKCPALTWSHDVQGGSWPGGANPYNTVAGATPQVTTFTVRAGAPDQSNKRITVSCTNPLLCAGGATCSLNVQVTSKLPTQLDCALANPHPQPFNPGESADVKGTCRDNTGTETFCPVLLWSISTSVSHGDKMEPDITPRMWEPVSTLTISSNPAGRNPEINAKSTLDPDPRFQNLQCTNKVRVQVGAGAVQPDIMVSLIPTSLYFTVGQTAKVDVITRNAGATAGASWTRARDTSLNACPPSEYRVTGYPTTSVYSCLCTDQNIGLHTITANGDADDEIVESNENNNAANNIFYCCPKEGCFQLACFDFF